MKYRKQSFQTQNCLIKDTPYDILVSFVMILRTTKIKKIYKKIRRKNLATLKFCGPKVCQHILNFLYQIQYRALLSSTLLKANINLCSEVKWFKYPRFKKIK